MRSWPADRYVSATFNASFQANGSDSLTGVPGVSLIVPAGDPFSPFGTNVALDRYVSGIPLTQHVTSETAHAGGHFPRHASSLELVADRQLRPGRDPHAHRERASIPPVCRRPLNADDPTFDPFGPNLGYLSSPLLIDRAHSLVQRRQYPARGQRHLVRSPGRPPARHLQDRRRGERLQPPRPSARELPAPPTFPRTGGSGQITLDLPLTSRRHHFLDVIGDLTANFNFAANHLSDFGTITTLRLWPHLEADSDRHAALVDDRSGGRVPTIQQVGNPNVLTPGVPVFDYVTGRTQFVSRLDGGSFWRCDPTSAMSSSSASMPTSSPT